VNGMLLASIWGFMFSAHALEALWVFSIVRKHAGNFSTGVRSLMSH
jgi:hypothetical protein